MSDRPEDRTGPENIEPTEPAEPAVPAGADAPEQGPYAGPDARPEVPWWQGPYPPQGPHDPQAYDPSTQGAYPGPYDPSTRGVPGPYDLSGPGGWQGGGPWPGGGQWGWGPSGGGWGYHVQSTPPPRPRRRGLAAAVVTVFTVLALLIGVGIGYDVWSAGSTPSSAPSFAPSGGTSRSTFSTTSSGAAGTKVSSATGAPSDIATIRSKVEPALVDINTVLGYETEGAAGTGMVLTSTGKVLTNNHVIEGATKISATDLGNGRTYSASVLGYTRTDDIAVIQLKGASGLKTVHVGNSSSVKVGEAVVAIGNAGGTGGVPSAAGGSVTALDQSITASDEGTLGTTYEHLAGLIESNSDIEPGDSGGPLVTTSGVVVGMDTAASASEGYSFSSAVTGRGYSIPINEAVSTARQIIAGKASTTLHIGGTAFLGGIFGTVVSSRTGFARRGFGSTPTFTPRTPTFTTGASAPAKGALVEGVFTGTPAQRAGLAATDVVTSVNGTPVTSASDLTKIMLRYHPGDSAKVGWTTPSGQSVTATVTFASGPAE